MTDPIVVFSRLQFWLLALGLALLPVALVLSHRAVGVLVLAGGLICGATPAFWQSGRQRTDFSQFWSNHRALAGYIFVSLCLWISLSSLWSPLGNTATLFLNILAPWLAISAIIWWLAWCDNDKAQQIGKWFAYAVFAAAVLLVFEAITGGMIRTLTPPTDTSWNQHKDMIALGRGTTILVMLAFPAGLILHRLTRTWISGASLLGLSAYAAFTFDIAANLLGLVAGLFAFTLALMAPRLTLRGLVFIALACLTLMPLIAVNIPADTLNQQFAGQLPVSWLQRLYVWQAVGAEIIEGLPFGHGADYARFLAKTSATIDIPGAYGPLQTIPTHPHNVFLQLWLETGLPGVILSAALLIFGANGVLSLPLHKHALAGLAALFALVLVSFSVEASLWQVWRIASIGLAVAGLTLLSRIEPAALKVL